ncbi:MAG: peptidoglycan DD-metalloendopeptidase family protein [Anaerolineae bacterium]
MRSGSEAARNLLSGKRPLYLGIRLHLARSAASAAGEQGVRNWVSGHTRKWLGARWIDDLLRSRIAAHIAVILLIALVIIFANRSLYVLPLAEGRLARLILPSQQISSVPATFPADTTRNESLLPSGSIAQDDVILMRAAVPYTFMPALRPRAEITTYVVKPGDTIFGIAAQFGIKPETIMWANGRFVEDNPDLLRVGQELVILPVDGVYHQVGKGDTIEKIAATFKVEPSAIIDYPLNNLDKDDPQIQVGQWLIVPGGTKPYVPRRVVAYEGPIPQGANKGTGSFGWPASGSITQGYWGRHRAIDIGSWEGAPVTAADSGFVVAAGWDSSGYGRMVLIDHGNGFQTLYAHLKVFYVKAGDSVAKGQKIGEVGATGNATGPHLHFEIRQNGSQRNPFGFLP